MFQIIGWQINGGKNSADYRGRVVRDDNTYLTGDERAYRSGANHAKRFDSVEAAVDFAIHWHSVNCCCSNQKYTRTVEKRRTIIDFGSSQYVIRGYRPRS